MDLSYVKLFCDFLEEIEPLTMEERGRLLTAMLDYSRTGEAPVETLTGNERILFPVCRQRIDRDKQSYERKVESARANGKKGGRPRKTESVISETEKRQDKDKDYEKEKEKDKDKDEDEEKDIGRLGLRHSPPTMEQVQKRCAEVAPSVDPARFWNYYQAVGWKVRGQPIRDWEAKLREWEVRDRDVFVPGRGSSWNDNPALNYIQRDIDPEEFERNLYYDVFADSKEG